MFFFYYNINPYFDIVNTFFKLKYILIAMVKTRVLTVILIKVKFFIKIKLNNLKNSLAIEILEILDLI